MQRARGVGRISVRAAGGVSRLAGLRQEGSARVRLLNPEAGGGGLCATLINTAGGLAGGDLFAWGAELDAGARLTMVTQACEKVYRTTGPPAVVTASATAGPRSRLEWLPQETILFEGASLQRALHVNLAPDAELLACEAVVLGRRAMGEHRPAVRLRDRWRVRRAGRLVFADDTRLETPSAEAEGAALLRGAGAFATVLYVHAEAAALLEPARALVGDAGGVSLVEDRLFCRLLAPDGFALRRTLLPLLQALRGVALPRLWSL